jgi:hypothetical protein
VLPRLRVGVTSAVRHAGEAEFSGFFRLIDLESGRVVFKAAVPEHSRRADDPNPRGGVRGAKGMSASGDRFVIANSDQLFVFDSTWSLVGDVTHPQMGAVHDVLLEGDEVWVTCTGADALLKLDRHGEVLDCWTWRSDTALVRGLGFDSLPAFDPSIDFRDPRAVQQGVHNIAHLNGVVRAGNGGLLLSFGRVLDPRTVGTRRRKARVARLVSTLGVSRPLPTKPTPVPASFIPGCSFAIVSLPPEGGPRIVLHLHGIGVPNHNLDELEDAIVYLDSNAGRLVVWDTAAGAERAAVPIPGSPSFTRGLARIDARRYLVGSQAPLALYEVDLDRVEVVSVLELDGAANESVYGICIVPEDFGDPPPPEELFSADGVAHEAVL